MIIPPPRLSVVCRNLRQGLFTPGDLVIFAGGTQASVGEMSVHKVRYGSFNLVIKKIRGEEFVAHVERALSRDRVGDVVKAPSFEEAVMSAKLEALRLLELA